MLKKFYLENHNGAQEMSSNSDYSTGVRPRKLDLQFYLRTLATNKWPIIAFTAIMTVAAIFYSLVTMSVYSASATLLLEPQSVNVTPGRDQTSSKDKSLEYVSTQTAILKSRMLAERVIQQIELSEGISSAQISDMLDPPLSLQIKQVFGFGNTSAIIENKSNASTNTVNRTNSKEYNQLLKQFRQSIRIKPIAKTKLIRVSYESIDPEFSALVANTIASEYIKSGLDQRSAFKDNTSAWMDGRVAELKLKLDKSEEALLLFKESNGLLDLNGGVGKLNEQELLTTSAELAEANSKLSNSRDLLRKVKNFKATAPELLETLPFVQNDVLIRSVQTQIGQVQRNLDESSNRYGPKHPQIVDAQARLRSLRSELSSHISRAVAGFENDYQLLSQRVFSLKASLEQGKESFQVLGKKRIALETLENEVNSNREQYKGLFDKILETHATDGLDEANAVVAEAAWVPTDSVKPRKLLIIGLTLIGSLLLAAAISSLVEFLNDTVTSTKDIESRLKTRLLGVLPLINRKIVKRKTGGKEDLPISPKDIDAMSETFTEAVNTCRTSLSVRNRRNVSNEFDYQVILVTSSEPDEGKSTVALNLAHSFGQLERTLLIDCDLRKPSIASALDIDIDAVGLSNLLTEKPPVDKFITHGVLDSFDCMTSGPISANPQEMLASDKFARILHFLRQRYDKIIIDCAPTHVVSDALVLSKMADSVVYVVKPHKTPIKLVYSGLSRLTEAGASVAGVCLTQVDLNKSNSHGSMEFHGFGVNYQYGNHYNGINEPVKPSKLDQIGEYIPLRKAS